VVSSEDGSSFLPKPSVLFEYFYYNGKILVSADIIKKNIFQINVFRRITVLPEIYRLQLPFGSFVVL
jgi:hypothetical protein